jgi:hypothetical protein
VNGLVVNELLERPGWWLQHDPFTENAEVPPAERDLERLSKKLIC